MSSMLYYWIGLLAVAFVLLVGYGMTAGAWEEQAILIWCKRLLLATLGQ